MTDRSSAGSNVGPVLPDVVYVVRPGDDNPELLHSLRSLEINGGPYGKVWIVGTVPTWARNIVPLPLEPLREKFENQRQSLEAVVSHPDLSDEFILFNDDFFMIQPVGDWPVFHRGLMRDYLANCGYTSEWTETIGAAAKWMESRGHKDVIAYEVHVPLKFDKRKFAALMAEYPKDLPFAAGELYMEAGTGGGGTYVGDSKVPTRSAKRLRETLARPMPYLSTNDSSFRDGAVGRLIRRMFPNPSKYEISGESMDYYDITIHGRKTTLYLSDEQAREHGLVPYSERKPEPVKTPEKQVEKPEEKAAPAPRNKSRKPANKAHK